MAPSGSNLSAKVSIKKYRRCLRFVIETWSLAHSASCVYLFACKHPRSGLRCHNCEWLISVVMQIPKCREKARQRSRSAIILSIAKIDWLPCHLKFSFMFYVTQITSFSIIFIKLISALRFKFRSMFGNADSASHQSARRLIEIADFSYMINLLSLQLCKQSVMWKNWLCFIIYSDQVFSYIFSFLLVGLFIE